MEQRGQPNTLLVQHAVLPAPAAGSTPSSCKSLNGNLMDLLAQLQHPTIFRGDTEPKVMGITFLH